MTAGQAMWPSCLAAAPVARIHVRADRDRLSRG
jgi:hypothetical protein